MDQEIELEIERLGVNGEGVASLEGFVLFVDGALPGERIRAKIYERRKSFGRASVVEILRRSPHRVEPVCPLFGRCGGCQLMHLAYSEQLKAKRQRVVDALERIGKISGSSVLSCLPSPESLSYRNKIQLPVSQSGKLGLYAQGSHDLIEIERCFIHSHLGERVFKEVQKLVSSKDDFRHVLIKTAVHTNEALVIVVTKGEEFPKGFAEKLLNSMPEIKGVVQNINAVPGNVILGPTFKTVAGQGWIQERLHNLLFKVSPASFFQVNPTQAEKLYSLVLEMCALEGGETVLDAFCGVGTLALILAKNAKEVVGIECVEDAISDAKENAQLNGICNANFICGLAEEKIVTLQKVDVAVLNPPRKGCEPLLLEKLAKLAPKSIVYISCDPATLARDLRFLIDRGYTLDQVQPLDMFPQTAHVECVVKLIKDEASKLA